MRVSELELVVTYSIAITAPDTYHTGAGRGAEDGLFVFKGGEGQQFEMLALPEIISEGEGHLST
jgi:hypothetical protein